MGLNFFFMFIYFVFEIFSIIELSYHFPEEDYLLDTVEMGYITDPSD